MAVGDRFGKALAHRHPVLLPLSSGDVPAFAAGTAYHVGFAVIIAEWLR